MRFLLLFVAILTQFLFAQEYSDTPDIEQTQLYINYEDVPEKIYLTQIFSTTIKVLSTEDHFEDIIYNFTGSRGVKLLSKTPKREIKGRYYYDTFSYIAQSHYMKLPDIQAHIKFSSYHSSKPTLLEGQNLLSIKLRDTRDFSHVVAKKFLLESYKTTKYSHSKNITLFSIEADNSDLSTFKLPKISKQGFQSLSNDYNVSKMSYYVVIANDIENLEFTYFNTISQKYEDIVIPIVVEDDSVSTQSDISPQENSHRMIKVVIATSFVAICLFLYILRRSRVYLLFMFFAIVYIGLNATPIQTICIKEGSYLHILPMQNSTLFDITKSELSLEVLDTVDDFTRVKIENKIGWLNNEDICSN